MASSRFFDAMSIVATTGGRAAEVRQVRYVCRAAHDDDVFLAAIMNLEVGRAGNTLLLSACKNGNLPLVQRLCRLGVNLGGRVLLPPRYRDIDHEREARLRGSQRRVKILYGVSPLREALDGGYLEIVDELRQAFIAHKSQYVNHADYDGGKALSSIGIAAAIGFGRDVKKCLLLNRAFSRSPLLCNMDFDAYFREKQRSIWEKQSSMDLQVATVAGEGLADRVAELILLGANINIVTENNTIALHEAGLGGHTSVLNLLMAHGATLEALVKMYPRGWTALHLAAMHSGDPILARLLLDQGASCDAITSWGKTPLHFACEIGNLQAVKLLCDSNANLSARSLMLWTPRDQAVASGHKEVAEFLEIRSRAGMNVTNDLQLLSVGQATKFGLSNASVERTHPKAKWALCMRLSQMCGPGEGDIPIIWYIERDAATKDAYQLYSCWLRGGQPYYSSDHLDLTLADIQLSHEGCVEFYEADVYMDDNFLIRNIQKKWTPSGKWRGRGRGRGPVFGRWSAAASLKNS